MELIDRQHQLEDEIHQTMSKDPNCECNGVNGCAYLVTLAYPLLIMN